MMSDSGELVGGDSSKEGEGRERGGRGEEGREEGKESGGRGCGDADYYTNWLSYPHTLYCHTHIPISNSGTEEMEWELEL